MFRVRLLLILFVLPCFLYGQLRKPPITRLLDGGALPEKILNGRSVVLYSPNFSRKEIEKIHSSLVRTGVDAVAYFEIDNVFAGDDVELAFQSYFTTREIACLLIIEKQPTRFKIWVTTFESAGIIKPDQVAWTVEDKSLDEALRVIYSTALNTYKRLNMLINDFPETELSVNVITARRTEAFASDLRVDKLAVQKFGDPKLDSTLNEIMKSYPFKYALVDANIPETDLRKQGYYYILKYVYTRGPAAKQLLGYDISKAVTAIASVTYPNGGEIIKTIPSDVPVYKFYTRQIEYNNVYLGNRWDADVTWQESLKNFIYGFRREMRVN